MEINMVKDEFFFSLYQIPYCTTNNEWFFGYKRLNFSDLQDFEIKYTMKEHF